MGAGCPALPLSPAHSSGARGVVVATGSHLVNGADVPVTTSRGLICLHTPTQPLVSCPLALGWRCPPSPHPQQGPGESANGLQLFIFLFSECLLTLCAAHWGPGGNKDSRCPALMKLSKHGEPNPTIPRPRHSILQFPWVAPLITVTIPLLPHFTNSETRAQKEVTCPELRSQGTAGPGLNTGHLAPGLVLLSGKRHFRQQ